MSTTSPTPADLRAIGPGSTVVEKQLYHRWNELVGSRWLVLSITTGLTRQTKILPEEKYLNPAAMTVFHLRPLFPRHGHFPTGQPNEWEISEGVLREQFEPYLYRTQSDSGPMF